MNGVILFYLYRLSTDQISVIGLHIFFLGHMHIYYVLDMLPNFFLIYPNTLKYDYSYLCIDYLFAQHIHSKVWSLSACCLYVHVHI